MRKLFKTTADCPKVQLYLELFQIPARFAIMKARLLFLKSILSVCYTSVRPQGTNNLFILGKYLATTLASRKTLSLEWCHPVLLPSPF